LTEKEKRGAEHSREYKRLYSRLQAPVFASRAFPGHIAEKPLVYVPQHASHPVLADGVMYWVEEEGGPYSLPAMIKSCAVTGCNQQPTTLVAAASKQLGSFTVAGLAVNDTRVYWSNADGVWACPKTACVTPTLMFPQKHPGRGNTRRR
jgi:hypothetical protein